MGNQQQQKYMTRIPVAEQHVTGGYKFSCEPVSRPVFFFQSNPPPRAVLAPQPPAPRVQLVFVLALLGSHGY